MSNSFNISVKPEITALEVKVDIIDTEVDAVRSTDIPGTNTKVDANNTILVDLHDTDIPGIDAKVTTLDTVADNIRNIDVPNIQTNIDANETKIDAIQTDQYFCVEVSDTEIADAAAEQNVAGDTYTKKKEILIVVPGEYRITFDLKSNAAVASANGRIYKNGVALGTEQSNATTDYVNKSEDLFFNYGDLCQLYLRHSNPANSSWGANFKLRGTISISKGSIILT